MCVSEGRLLLLWSEMDKALCSDMSNGSAKKFVYHIITYIENMAGLSVTNVQHTAPVNTSDTNSDIQYVMPTDTLSWDSPYDPPVHRHSSPSSSFCESSHMLLTCEPDRSTVVPDYVVFLPDYPGKFLLNVECKKSQNSFSAAIVQCTRQMLTQMHFQTHAIGMVISPLNWSLILLQKGEANIKFSRFEESFVQPSRDNPSVYKLNVPGMISLHNWIYRIMAWGVPGGATASKITVLGDTTDDSE